MVARIIVILNPSWISKIEISFMWYSICLKKCHDVRLTYLHNYNTSLFFLFQLKDESKVRGVIIKNNKYMKITMSTTSIKQLDPILPWTKYISTTPHRI